MALPRSIPQREGEKFVEDALGKVTVRVTPSTAVLPTDAATETKQDDIITELEKKANLTETQPVTSLDTFNTNNIDDNNTTASTAYIGLEDKDGTWVIKKIDYSVAATPEFTYATITNNGAVATYAAAWAAISTLTYQVYSSAF